MLCGGRNTESLFDSKCFYPNISQVHMFCSKLSWFCMFCDDYRSKSVKESTYSRVSWVVNCRKPAQKTKKWRCNNRTKVTQPWHNMTYFYEPLWKMPHNVHFHSDVFSRYDCKES